MLTFYPMRTNLISVTVLNINEMYLVQKVDSMLPKKEQV